MNRKPGVIATAIVLLYMFGLATFAWPQIAPDARIPIHWNFSGTPNGFASKPVGLLAVPLLAVALAAILVVIPLIEPRRMNLAQSGRAYTAFWIGILAVVAAAQTAAILSALGQPRLSGAIGVISVGGVFVVIGNYFPKLRSNFFVGIRTPWTLSSERSWNRTHRLGGRLFVLTGALVVLTALVGNSRLTTVVLIGSLVVSLAVMVVYSYLVWRVDPAKVSLGR